MSCTSTQFNFHCPACPLGKSSRLTLKTTGHQTQAPLDLIFSDVWGPSPMLSSDGFRYFVIFVDAHTKFIWFYPLTAKSDVFAIFHQFQALVERQFSLKIKSVQTDWGGEYRKLNTYFKTIGIHHRVICPHTHEQNDMVERSHRHIVETGLTLLGQCHAPLKYWSYAFESSVYLINRMPTPVLNNKTPFECLLKSTPDYAFLRTFGCLCFPFLRPYNAHKLDFRSTPCVFLGYSTSHVGYRCLDLSSKRIYLARHVRFHENVFPLDKIEQIAATPKQPSAPSIPVTLHPLMQPSSVPSPLPPTLPTLPPAHFHYLHVIMIILPLQVQIRHTHKRHPMLLPAPLFYPLFAPLLWVLLLLGLLHGLIQVLPLFPLLVLPYVLIFLSSIFSMSLPLSPVHLSGFTPILWCFDRGKQKMLILALRLSRESRPYLSRSHCPLRTQTGMLLGTLPCRRNFGHFTLIKLGRWCLPIQL